MLYNIPQRTGSDMSNDLLAELAQFDNIVAVKQANADNLAKIDGLRIYAGNDDLLADVLDLGEAGGILVASHLFGEEMHRMVDEPDRRRDDRRRAERRLRRHARRAAGVRHQGGAQPARAPAFRACRGCRTSSSTKGSST